MSIDCLLHVHSSFSYDSKTELSDIAARARREGYGCILMSEHNNTLDQAQVDRLVARCGELSNDSLLIVPGLELSFDDNRVHLLAYGVRRFIDSTSPGRSFADLVGDIHAQGGLAVFAHPSHRRAFERVAPADLARLDGIEIWNVKNGNRFCPDGIEVGLLRRVRASGGRAWAYGGVDLHHLARFTRLAVRVAITELSERAILAELRAGRFTIAGPAAKVGAAGDVGALRLRLFGAAASILSRARVRAYRWQAALERRGFRTPRIVAAIARKLF